MDSEGVARSGPNGIVNGDETRYEIWKGVVALRIGGSLCTATLIDPDVVLTAAHCTASADISWMSIHGGSDLLYDPIDYADISEKVIHPGWVSIRDPEDVDLAMLRLSDSVTAVESYGIRGWPPVPIGETGKIVGYGITSSGANDGLIHRVGDTTVLKKGTSPGQIAMKLVLGDPAGNCEGDSGGPFLTDQAGEWMQAGVASGGEYSVCTADSGNHDIDVYVYRDWIDQTMQQLTGHGIAADPGPPPADTDTATTGDDDDDNDPDSDSLGDDDDSVGDDDDDNDDTDVESGDGGVDDGVDGGEEMKSFGLDQGNPVGCSVAVGPAPAPIISSLFNALL